MGLRNLLRGRTCRCAQWRSRQRLIAERVVAGTWIATLKLEQLAGACPTGPHLSRSTKMKVFRVHSASPPLRRALALNSIAICALAAALTLNARPVGHAPDRVLLKLKAGVTDTDARTIISSQEAVEAQNISGAGVRVLKVSPSKLAKVLEALSRHPQVEFAEPDAIIEPDFTPNDPYFASEWHLATIAAPAAWDLTMGSANVVIAILDTGVDGTHPDLSAKLVAGWNTYDNSSGTSHVDC